MTIDHTSETVRGMLYYRLRKNKIPKKDPTQKDTNIKTQRDEVESKQAN